MGKRLDMSGGRRSGPLRAQHVLRLISILVGIVGVTYLGLAYYKRTWSRKPRFPVEAPSGVKAVPARRIDDNATGYVEYEIDLRTFPLPGSADNAPTTPPDDNAADVAAIVGLESIKDGATIEPQPLYYLLRQVEERRPADDLFMRRVPVVTLAELRADPDRFRAKPVTIRGKIIRLKRSTLAENPSGIREVLDGDLLVGQEGICMFLASRIAPVRENQVVDIHGIFMKLVRYSGKGGRQEDAPLVITSHPAPVCAPRGAVRKFPTKTIFTILVVLFVVYFVMVIVLRRRQQAVNPRLQARRKTGGFTFHPPEHDEPEEKGEEEETKEP